jgi:GAF domain
MSTPLSLVSELERLVTAVVSDGDSVSQISLPSIAERIAKSLNVKKDEVAILGLSNKWKHLYFLVPEALKNVGFIPLSSNASLAARTVKESRPDIVNNFPGVRHVTVFESVKMSDDPTEAIQKIISAPILVRGKIVGVMQISRKGPSPAAAGPDFTADDLGKVLALCKPLGKILLRLSPEDGEPGPAL